MDGDAPAPTAGPPGPAGPLPVPTTFGGVAAVARRPFGWLAAWQLCTALAAGILIAWSANTAWGPAILRAAEALPEAGAIRDGRLLWTNNVPEILDNGPFVSVVMDPTARRESGLTSDVTLSLEEDGVGLRSLLGWAWVPYPPGLAVSLNRLEAVSLVTAWRGPVVLGTAFAVAFGLLLTWAVLGGLYGLVLWPAARALGREPTLGQAWRLGAASLLPGALLMTAAIVLYASRQLSLLGLLLVGPLHLLAGWMYAAGGLVRWPKPEAQQAANPFTPEPPPDAPAPVPRPVRSENPFQRP